MPIVIGVQNIVIYCHLVVIGNKTFCLGIVYWLKSCRIGCDSNYCRRIQTWLLLFAISLLSQEVSCL